MKVKIEESWSAVLSEEFDKPYFKSLTDFVRSEYQSKTIYPEGQHIFNAFNHCPIDQVKVVILGQDPYHGPGQAHGLAFSVKEGVCFPPSLSNIFKELQRDLDIPFPPHGNLERWADQGVFLLNATNEPGHLAPISRIGSGQVAVDAAAQAQTVLYRR